MKKALTFISFLSSSVMIAVAQVQITVGQTSTAGTVNAGPLMSLLASAQDIAGKLVPFAITVAVLAFFWYLIKFITQGGESGEKKEASMKGMGYSILALFIMVSVWGIIGLLGNMLGVGQGGIVPTPGVPTGFAPH